MSTLLALLLATAAAGAPAAAPADAVVVVTELVPRGGKVDRSNVELVERSAVELPRMLKPHVWRDADRLRARRVLRPGQIVSSFDVEPMPDVAAGDAVIVEVVAGNVRVTASGIAKQDGFAGEQIWIENDATRRRLRVRVIEPGRVALDAPFGRRR